jgi:RNA recognition motif-containing protein
MASDEQGNIVWVNRLSKNVVDEDIKEHFKECGEIKTIFICSSKNRNFTYCFIEFVNNDCAQKALVKNNTSLGDTQIVVALADNTQYDRSVKRTDARSKLNDKIEEEIKDMNKLSSYYYGFSQGKKYMLKKMARTQPIKRNVRQSRDQSNNN